MAWADSKAQGITEENLEAKMCINTDIWREKQETDYNGEESDASLPAAVLKYLMNDDIKE